VLQATPRKKSGGGLLGGAGKKTLVCDRERFLPKKGAISEGAGVVLQGWDA